MESLDNLSYERVDCRVKEVTAGSILETLAKFSREKIKGKKEKEGMGD